MTTMFEAPDATVREMTVQACSLSGEEAKNLGRFVAAHSATSLPTNRAQSPQTLNVLVRVSPRAVIVDATDSYCAGRFTALSHLDDLTDTASAIVSAADLVAAMRSKSVRKRDRVLFCALNDGRLAVFTDDAAWTLGPARHPATGDPVPGFPDLDAMIARYRGDRPGSADDGRPVRVDASLLARVLASYPNGERVSVREQGPHWPVFVRANGGTFARWEAQSVVMSISESTERGDADWAPFKG